MKALLVAFALVAIGSSSYAQEAPISVKFNRIQADAKLGEIVGAEVLVDMAAKEITLTLQPAMPHCPAGMACIMVMPQPQVITLPIVEVKTSDCGDRYIARQDLRPVDGGLREITLIDYSLAICERVINEPFTAEYTTSLYSRMAGQEIRTFSAFGYDPTR